MIFRRDEDDADPVAATAPESGRGDRARSQTTNQGGGMADNNGEVTIVGTGARLEGNVVSAGNLRIDGQVKGQINADGDVTLSPQSQVEADIRAQNVSVAGKFKGNLDREGQGTPRPRRSHRRQHHVEDARRRGRRHLPWAEHHGRGRHAGPDAAGQGRIGRRPKAPIR